MGYICHGKITEYSPYSDFWGFPSSHWMAETKIKSPGGQYRRLEATYSRSSSIIPKNQLSTYLQGIKRRGRQIIQMSSLNTKGKIKLLQLGWRSWEFSSVHKIFLTDFLTRSMDRTAFYGLILISISDFCIFPTLWFYNQPFPIVVFFFAMVVWSRDHLRVLYSLHSRNKTFLDRWPTVVNKKLFNIISCEFSSGKKS